MTDKIYILDTDIGDDIDDAFALDYALKKELPLAGITTVFKNTLDRARITKKLLKLYGKNIPVYAGLSQTLDKINRSTEHCCQWTDDLATDEYAPENISEAQAVDFIIDCAEKFGTKLVILAIGPLTNIAAAIEKNPQVMNKIGGIIMMGGDYYTQYAEWNIFCDVAAANIVFSCDIPITAFGHEVTSLFKITEKQQQYILGMNSDKYHAYLAELARLWILSKPINWRIVLHDVLVIRKACEDFCETKEIHVHLETNSSYAYGMTANIDKFDLSRPTVKCKKINVAINPDINEIIADEMKNINFKED